jgi:hypothetical protein
MPRSSSRHVRRIGEITPDAKAGEDPSRAALYRAVETILLVHRGRAIRSITRRECQRAA